MTIKKTKSMKKEQILFNHFLCDIYDAAGDFYDLRPLRCKKFAGSEIISLFKKFESIVVSKDSFWEKSSVISYIYEDKHSDKGLKELSLDNQQYYLLDDKYQTDDFKSFFSPPIWDSCFCVIPGPGHNSSYDSSYWFCPPRTPFYLNYLSILVQMRAYYGESYYERIIIPHMIIFKEAVVEVLSLKKFPFELIRKNTIALLKDTYEDGDLGGYYRSIDKIKKLKLDNSCPWVDTQISTIYNTCKTIEAHVKIASDLKSSLDNVFKALEDEDYSLFSEEVIKLGNNTLHQINGKIFEIKNTYETLKNQLMKLIEIIEATWVQVASFLCLHNTFNTILYIGLNFYSSHFLSTKTCKDSEFWYC